MFDDLTNLRNQMVSYIDLVFERTTGPIQNDFSKMLRDGYISRDDVLNAARRQETEVKETLVESRKELGRFFTRLQELQSQIPGIMRDAAELDSHKNLL